MGLILEMINPYYSRATDQPKQKLLSCYHFPLYQSLHMDLTSYQTLKQLIV